MDDGRGSVLGEHALEAGAGHREPAAVEEEFGDAGPRGAYSEPCTQVCCSLLPERQSAFAPAFAGHPKARLRMQGESSEGDRYQLRDSKARGVAQMQHGPVTQTVASRDVRRLQ